MKCSILLLFLFCISQQCSASIDGIDGIPYLSQLKSIYQLLGGDKEGAIRTQENFINETRFISQLNSFKQIINGDVGDAEGIQEQLGKILEETANEIPIVGQIKVKY